MRIAIAAGIVSAIAAAWITPAVAQVVEAAEGADDLTRFLALVSAITAPACGGLAAALWRVYKDKEALTKRHEQFLRDCLKRISEPLPPRERLDQG